MFEVLRDRVGLDQIVSANGPGKARCVSPDHQDEDPSMHLYDDHAHCFACGFHGDVTDVWTAMRGFDKLVEAALDLAEEFGIELPEVSPEACQTARERRAKEDLYLQQAKACHEALARHPRVTQWWEARGFGEELRERFLLGTNKHGTAAVIPFWHRGRVKGFIRRSSTRKKGAGSHPTRRVLEGGLAGDGGSEGRAREARLRGDECGTHTSLAPLYGYAPRGERLRPSVPRRRGKNTTLLSSMTLCGMGASLAVEGATTARVFETYVEEVLVPSLHRGQIVVMDKLGAHRPKRVRGLIEQRGCEFLYLPSYSPDYNPIEEAFAKIKNLLHGAAARSKEALVEAIGVALWAVSAADARGFFEHAGYHRMGQLL